MQNDTVKLHCPNDLCQAANRQTDKFCQQCGTPMLKRYLWAVGEGIEAYKPGDIWRDRYLVKSERIVLDTKPGITPEAPTSEIPDQIKHYLRLVPYRLHVPQVYAVVPVGEGLNATEILLLDQAPIYPDGVPQAGQLMPQILDVWCNATSMRQLNWLWQIAQVWQPLESEGIAKALLEPKLLRVEGSLVRLLELPPQQNSTPTLASLGQLWLLWVSEAKQGIAGFLEQLCQALIQGEVRSCDQLIAILDRGIAEVGRKQTRSLQITTRTDAGPSRQRNEDACYPPSGTIITQSPQEASNALVIVCDGIGGHEGGNVASNLAIETIQQQLQSVLLADADLDSTTLSGNLERVACTANDQISQRNDSEHRYGRQRMGTTLVMGLGRAHEMYITHVGDSRAYWITRTGCHQITLDDDVASREVRLGYALYQDALQQASSGSLVQALGMSASASLHPTVQRFVLDEDCVFLLCSDGLSDYDRVEQCWETEILPILDGTDVAAARERLVEIANTQNGHDNVTVGIIYCQISSFEPAEISASLAQQIITLPGFTAQNDQTIAIAKETKDPQLLDTSSKLQTELIPSEHAPGRSFLPVLLGIMLLLGLGGGLLAYLFIPEVSRTVNPLIGLAPTPSPSYTPKISSSSTLSPATSPSAPLLKASPLLVKSTINSAVLLYHKRENKSAFGRIPKGAIVQITAGTETDSWLPVTVSKVCLDNTLVNSSTVPHAKTGDSQTNSTSQVPEALHSANSNTYKLVQVGSTGWIRRTDIEHYIEPLKQNQCPMPPTSTPSK